MATEAYVEIHGYALRVVRRLVGPSTQELAERAGVTDAYVRAIELGKRQQVSPTVYRKFLSALAIQDYRALLANPHGTGAMAEPPVESLSGETR